MSLSIMQGMPREITDLLVGADRPLAFYQLPQHLCVSVGPYQQHRKIKPRLYFIFHPAARVGPSYEMYGGGGHPNCLSREYLNQSFVNSSSLLANAAATPSIPPQASENPVEPQASDADIEKIRSLKASARLAAAFCCDPVRRRWSSAKLLYVLILPLPNAVLVRGVCEALKAASTASMAW
ncbi:hypothetical protein B0H12DRAFT_669428 [Mycena haematopus]|nr:hypothetical protein B0H12DRAFT_669428 [Mycena haematopus]